MRSIMHSVQQLLPLLIVSAVSAGGDKAGHVSAAAADLRATSMQSAVPEVAEHLGHLRATILALRTASGAGDKLGLLAGVEQCMRELHRSSLQLGEAGARAVLKECHALQNRLAQGGPGGGVLKVSTSELQALTASMSKRMEQMRDDLKVITEHLAELHGFSTDDADPTRTERILQVWIINVSHHGGHITMPQCMHMREYECICSRPST